MANISEEHFRKLQKEVEGAKAEAERAKGALSQIKAQMKERFQCDSLKEAKAKLAELEVEKERQEARLAKLVKRYERKWNGSTSSS